MSDAVAERACDSRGDPEILVGGAHADLDLPSAVIGNLGVPLRRVGADATVDRVEVVAVARWLHAAAAFRGWQHCAGRSGDGRESGAPQERPSIKLTVLRHRCLPPTLRSRTRRRTSRCRVVRWGKNSRLDAAGEHCRCVSRV